MCEDTKEIQEHPETQRRILDMRRILAELIRRLEDRDGMARRNA